MTAHLKAKIQEDVEDAMRSRDRERLGALRQVTAAIKQREVDERIELSDADVLAVLDKMLKQRRDAHGQFSAAGRNDLADKEAFEINLIEGYLPSALDDAEITALIEAAVVQTEAQSMRDMGKVMGVLKDQMQGRADLGQVSARVKTRLSPA